MPALPNFLNPKSSSEPHTVPPIPITTYYLTTSPPSPTSLRPISPPRPGPQAIPPSSLLFSLTHPSPSTSDTTLFFLTCLPDPIGFLHHSAHFIRPHLSRSSTQNPSSSQAQAEAWRHQMMELILEDEPGLAATSGGRIHVSLQWVGGVMREVQGGKRDMQSAVKEFKGVLLHELVHTIQHDGAGTCPGWLIESIADHLRLLAHLDPPHWLKPGQGRRERGWEDAYDAGARFLAWLTGDEAESGGNSDQETETIEDDGGLERGLASMTIARPAQPTRYPQPGESSVGSSESGAKRPPQGRPRPRRPPVPDLVRQMDERMGREKVEEGWWVEMAGATLEELWTEYLDYYASE